MKNKKLIREDIESIKFMMNYDTRKTLTENRDILNEQAFPTKPNPGAWADQVAGDIGDAAVYTAGTDVKKIYDNIQKIKTVQHFYDVQSLLSKKTGGQYKDFNTLINGEFEGDNLPYVSRVAYHFKQIPGLSSTYSVNARTPQNPDESFKVGSFTVVGVPNDSRLKSVSGSGGEKDKPKQDDPATAKKPDATTKKAITPTPAELKDSAGIIKFQDWLDTNKPGWATGFPEGKLNKGSGYGKFGPRTSKAWTAYGKEYLNSSKTPVDTSTISAPAVQTYATADQTKNTPALETLSMGVSGPANQVAQPTTTTSATNPNKYKELKLQ
jgi:hypothetical protein